MNIKELSMSYGLQTIFDNINIQINSKEKVGIVGVNGAGKSTLFKLILKEIEPDKGKIIIKNNPRIGFLPQVIKDEIPSENISVFEYLLSGRPIKKLEKELTKTYEKISTESNEIRIKSLMKTISNLQAKLEYYNVYEAENILLKIITGMNIDTDLLDLPLSKLSGGQKSKIAFARLLYSNPEILLLDEPTNHLDQDTKEYIINYLKNYNGMVLVISHDIDFLDSVTTSTLYIDKISHKAELFPGSYKKFKKIKEEREKTIERISHAQQKEEEKLKRIIAKYIGGNEKKARIAKDRQKKLARLEKEKVATIKKNKEANFQLKIEEKSGIIPIKVTNLSFGYNKNLLYKNLTFDIARGEKFLIIGENGIGKSTLLKLLMNYLQPLSGTIEINNKTTIGYYAQEHELLENEKNILENFDNANLSSNQLRSYLGNFLFTNNEVYKKIKYLSPGERSRVALAKISINKPNLLILDEPTNHLDPETQRIIANTFKDYDGTILLVSHNLVFVDNLGINRMLLPPSGEIKYYDKNIVKHFQEINK